MKALGSPLVGLVVVLSVVGCGPPGLSREDASGPIESAVRDTEGATIGVRLGYGVRDYMEKVLRIEVDATLLDLCVDRGYLEVDGCEERTVERGVATLEGKLCGLFTTPEGDEFFNSHDCLVLPDFLGCIVARREFLDVTGVARDDPSARVDFVWEWRAEPLAEELGETELLLASNIREIAGDMIGPNPGVAQFQLYDDGWRMLDMRLK